MATDIQTDGLQIEYVQDPGMTDRLLSYEQKMDELSPKMQARLVWSKRFRRALKTRGMSQQALSDAVGVHPSLVSSWANAVSMPKNDVMQKLSVLFKEDVSKWTVPEKKEVWTASVVTAQPLVLSEEEEALIRRVRRMSEEERDALFTLLHVLR